MTPITYIEAQQLLGVATITLKGAVRRGVLTRLPRQGLYQHLIKEQVELFKGRMLSLSALSPDEMKQWQNWHNQAVTPSISLPQSDQGVLVSIFEQAASDPLVQKRVAETLVEMIGGGIKQLDPKSYGKG